MGLIGEIYLPYLLILRNNQEMHILEIVLYLYKRKIHVHYNKVLILYLRLFENYVIVIKSPRSTGIHIY